MHTLKNAHRPFCTSGTLMLLLFTDPGLSDEGGHLRAASSAASAAATLQVLLPADALEPPNRPDLGSSVSLLK